MANLLQELRQLWNYKPLFRVAIVYLTAWILLALFLPLIPLPYAPDFLDLEHILQPPFQESTNYPSHYLGTDAIGRDVFANVLYGARTGFLIAIPIMCLSSLIGVMLGTFAGYFGDESLKSSRASIFILLPLILFSLYYYGLYVPANAVVLQLLPAATTNSYGILAFVIGMAALVFKPFLHIFSVLKHRVTIPLDFIVVRLIEVMSSIPWLIIVLILASFMQPSVKVLAFILILTSWMGIARLARAEILRVKTLPYFEAATSMGVSTKRILLCHALPNMLGPLLTSFVFGLASLLTIESTLSFLGIGIPPTVASWGRIITGIRSDTSAWWLVVFPGLFLAATVMALQAVNHYLLSIISNKKKL